MIWSTCLLLSVIILNVSAVYSILTIKRYSIRKYMTPFNAIFIGVLVAVMLAMAPVFIEMLQGESGFILKVFMFDLFQAIQVFTVNVGYDFILDNISDAVFSLNGLYSGYITFLFLLAPILTFGFVISLFRNAMSGILYKLDYWREIFVFSELNDKSLVLARDIKKHRPKSRIVFMNVDKDEEGEDDSSSGLSERIEESLEIGALGFKKDIMSVDFSFHSKRADITFFTIGEKEGDNLTQSLKLLSKYGERERTSMYVFSTSVEGEILLANADYRKMKIRRVDEIRSLVYQYFYENGQELFTSALRQEKESAPKKIHAIVLGLGKTGTEMVKTLTWFCQMDGYEVEIDAFDENENAEELFAGLCPELISEQYNGVRVTGECQYTIRIHSGVDVRTRSFAEHLTGIQDMSYIFVCLGDDSDNICSAANVRMLAERAGCKPVIRTICYSKEESNALAGIKNFSGQEYELGVIGDLESQYSMKVLMGSELEMLALQRHLKWGSEEEFWQYEYNYRSSMASAIHRKVRIFLGIPGAEKKEEELTQEERDLLENLEHKRWNAYMRSEGYVYSGSPDRSSRNNLAKMHHNLVAFKLLSEEDQRKDSRVATD